MLINFTFNSYDFQNAFIVDESSTHQSMPDKSVNDIQYLARDGGARTGSRFPSKTIKVTGTVTGTSQTNYHENKDTFKQNLGVKGAYELTIEDDKGIRVWPKAECRILEISEGPGWVTAGEFTLEFYCYDPIARASSTSNYANDDITATPETDTVTFAGTYDPLPVITIDVDTAGTIDSIKLKNSDTNEEVEISGISANGDQIIIDTEEQKITLNSVEIEGIGKIPTWNRGVNNYRLEMWASGGLAASQTEYSAIVSPWNGYYYAQSFQLAGAASVTQIDLLLRAQATPEADLDVEIQTDNVGEPSGTPVANGTTIIDKDDVPLFPGSYQWMAAEFSPSPALAGTTTYWIVCMSDITTWANRWQWQYINANLYADGEQLRSGDSGANWIGHNWDNTFKIYTTAAAAFNVDIDFTYYPRYL